MSKRQSFLIAGEIFKTKSALQERIKEILHQHPELPYLAQKDFAFMFDVLKLHPDADIKIGVGVKTMYVKQNPIYTHTRNFWVVREDDSETDFSYLECLKETPHEKRFVNACRVAIELYMIDFKSKFFEQLNGQTGLCPITGESITFTTCHVDHKAPKTFKSIVSRFIADKVIDVNKVKINGKGEDGVFQDTFDDKQLAKMWIDYHNANAELQIVSHRANLSLLKTAATFMQ